MVRKILTCLSIFFSTLTLVNAQTGIIKGSIEDNDGLPLIGVNVIVKGTTTGSITDIDGNYTISNVPTGSQIIAASFIGYTTNEKTVDISEGQTLTLNFKLVEDVTTLDELVVIGFGTKRKRDITSSIARIKSEEMANASVPSFESALVGKAAGVQVTQDNGMAGGGVTIRVRGTSSLGASSEPLYVVDGVPIVQGGFLSSADFPEKSNILSQLDQSNIESIEVLKDASAAAIYGSRAANGVVLITTKSGKKGDAKFDVNYSHGVITETNRLDVLDGPGYIKYTQQAYLNSYYHGYGSDEIIYDNEADAIAGYWTEMGANTPEEIAKIENTNTDWIDEMLRVGSVDQFNLSASGGNEKTTYLLGGAIRDEKGVLLSNDYKRMNGNLKIDHKATDKFTFGSGVTISYSENDRVPTGWAGGLGTAQSRSLPITPIYNDDGTFYEPRSGVNMLADDANREYTAFTTSLLGNIYGDYKITSWLSFRSEWGINNHYIRERKYVGTLTSEDAFAMDRNVSVNSWNTNNFLSFNKNLDAHKISGMLGQQASGQQEFYSEFNGKKFPSDELKNPNSGSIKGGTSNEEEFYFLSYIGRAAYSYNNKYLIDFSMRADGSSRFGPDNKWGYFPAGSIGWVISDENFMQGVPYLSFLKLRGSYGATGNANIGNYKSFGTFYSTSYNGEPGIGVSNVENLELGWETTYQLDIGFDFALLEGRFSGGFDYYDKQTKDMLLDVNIPQTSGASRVTRNTAQLENKGFELFIDAKILTGEFRWDMNINLSKNNNKILDLSGQVLAGENYGNNFAVEGYPIGMWRLVQDAGVDPETGKPLFINQETGLATDEWNFERDAIQVGNPYPELTGGITNDFRYKGFDLNFLFTFSVGQDVYRDDGKFFEGGNIGSGWNQMSSVEDAWKQPGDNADIPVLLWNNTYANYNTTAHLDKASYLRLKTLSFGYTLPKSLTKKVKIDLVRLYVNGQNLLTFTDFPGWDPEVNRDGSGNITQGVTYLSPPQMKTISFGIKANF